MPAVVRRPAGVDMVSALFSGVLAPTVCLEQDISSFGCLWGIVSKLPASLQLLP